MTVNKTVLDGILVFVEVVESGGFTAAARKLGHSVSFVSKEIAKLEDRLETRLLNRTTRNVSTTEAGQAYYDKCQQIVIDAQDAERRLTEAHENPQGLLRASVPTGFSNSYLNAELPEFLNRYPEIKLDIEINDRVVDVIAEGLDVVIRAGHLKDSNLIARRLMNSRMMVLAAPSYLEQYGTPRVPADLQFHKCITYSYKQFTTYWDFIDQDGNPIGVTIDPVVICNHSETEKSLAVDGVGILQLPSFICRQELDSGQLIPILEDFEMPAIGVYAVYPHRAYLSAKLRVFIDFLVEKFGKSKAHP